MTDNERKCYMRRQANDIKEELRNHRTAKIREATEAIKNNPAFLDALCEMFALWQLNEINAVYTTLDEWDSKKGLLALTHVLDFLNKEKNAIEPDPRHIKNADVSFEVLEQIKGWTWSHTHKSPYKSPYLNWAFVFCKDNKPIAGFDSEEEMHAFCQHLTTTTEGMESTSWCKATKKECDKYPDGTFFARKEWCNHWKVYRMARSGYAYAVTHVAPFNCTEKQAKRIADFLNKENKEA